MDLNGRWAVPGTTYGEEILKLCDELYAFAAKIGQPPSLAPNSAPKLDHWAENAFQYLTDIGVAIMLQFQRRI